MSEEFVDIRHLYNGTKLYKSSYRYELRYYKLKGEAGSSIFRLKYPAVSKAIEWVCERNREAVIFHRKNGRIVERFIHRDGHLIRLPMI